MQTIDQNISVHYHRDTLDIGEKWLKGAPNINRNPESRLENQSVDVLTLEWQHLRLLEPHAESGAVLSMAISPDGKYIASGHEDKTIRIWTIENTTLAYKLVNGEDGGDRIYSLVWSPDSRKIISGSDDFKGTIWVIDDVVGECMPMNILEGHTADVQTVSISPDGTKVATGSVDASVKLWNVETGENYASINDLGGMVMCTTFSQDSKRLAVAVDTTAWVYDAETGSKISEFIGHTGMLWALSFSSNGERIVTSSEDHTARVWKTQTGDEPVTIDEHSGPVWSVAFSLDDREILIGSYDSLAFVCDSLTGERRLCLDHSRKGSPGPISVVSYTPDGAYIVVGHSYGAVRIWESATGTFVAEIQGHKDKVKHINFTPDGSKLVSSGDDGTVRIWDLAAILVSLPRNSKVEYSDLVPILCDLSL